MDISKTRTRKTLPFVFALGIVALVAASPWLRHWVPRMPAREDQGVASSGFQQIRVECRGDVVFGFDQFCGIRGSYAVPTVDGIYRAFVYPGDYIRITARSEVEDHYSWQDACYPWQGGEEILFSSHGQGIIDVSTDGGTTWQRLSMDLRREEVLKAFMLMSAGDPEVPLQVYADRPSRAVLEQMSKLRIQGAVFLSPPAPDDLPYWPQLKYLTVGFSTQLPNLDFLREMEALERLELSGVSGEIDLEPIVGLPLLRTLVLSVISDYRSIPLRGLGDFDISSLVSLAGANELKSLSVIGGRDEEASSGQWLVAFPKLETLELRAFEGTIDLTQLRDTPLLKRLYLQDIGAIANISAVGELKAIEALTIGQGDPTDDAREAEAIDLGDLPRLQALSLAGYSISDLGDLRRSSSLKLLVLGDLGSVTSVDGIGELTELELLGLANGGQLVDINDLAGLRHLRELHLGDLDMLTTIDSIGSLESLESLVILNCDRIESFEPVGRLKTLTYLVLDESVSDETVDQLETMLPQCEVTCFVAIPF